MAFLSLQDILESGKDPESVPLPVVGIEDPVNNVQIGSITVSVTAIAALEDVIREEVSFSTVG